jgi:putative FmdB family regulatory protein
MLRRLDRLRDARGQALSMLLRSFCLQRARCRAATSYVQELLMPTYEYRCITCGKVFERQESMSEHGKSPPICPQCQGKQVEPVFSAFFAKTSRKS